MLATRFGVAAIDAVHDGAWGMMPVLRGEKIVNEQLSVAVGKTRTVDMELFHGVAEHFFA